MLVLIASKGTYETQRTDLGSKSRGSTDFTTGCPQVDDLDFVGVLEFAHYEIMQGVYNCDATHELGGHGEC